MNTEEHLKLFRSLLGQKFTVLTGDDENIEVVLIDITEDKKLPNVELQPFTLSFEASLDQKILNQGTYLISNNSYKKTALFMIPRMPTDKAMYYDIIFN